MIKRLEARRLKVRSFVMQGGIELITQDEDISGDHYIQARFPDQIRAEVTGPFNSPVMTLVCASGRLFIYDHRNNLLHRGAATRRNMARYLGIALSPAEIYTLLSGSAPLLKHESAELIRLGDSGSLQLNLSSNQHAMTQGVIFSGKDFTEERAWYSSGNGTPAFEADFSDFITYETSRYPLTVKISDARQRKISLFNDDFSINPSLPDSVFRLDAPRGAEVREIP